MFHLLAFEEAVGTTANTDLDAIADQVFAIQNSHFFPSQPLDLVFAAYCSATANRARIVTPRFRQYTYPVISPPDANATFGADPNYYDLRQMPLRLNAFEEIAIEGTSDIAMGTEQSYGIIGVTPRLRPAPVGDIFTLRGTSTTAAVANTWTQLAVTWADTLPAGVYAVVGMACIGVTEVAARIIFNDQVWRPGCLGSALVANKQGSIFRLGGLGEWGRFRYNVMPNIEVLNVSTTAVHTVYLDVIPVAA